MAEKLTADAEEIKGAATAKLWNKELGVFMASTGFESHNVDVWGNAMVRFRTPSLHCTTLHHTIPPRESTRTQRRVNSRMLITILCACARNTIRQAGAIGFATPEQDAAMFAYFSKQENNIFYEGQVREIPFPHQWTFTSSAKNIHAPMHPTDPRGAYCMDTRYASMVQEASLGMHVHEAYTIQHHVLSGSKLI